MSQNRKARVRSRLREVDSVIEAIKASGVQLKALVSISIWQRAQDSHLKGGDRQWELTRRFCFPRTRPSSYRQKRRWRQKTNTQSTANTAEAIANRYTRSASQEGCVDDLQLTSNDLSQIPVFTKITQRTNPKGF